MGKSGAMYAVRVTRLHLVGKQQEKEAFKYSI